MGDYVKHLARVPSWGWTGLLLYTNIMSAGQEECFQLASVKI